MAQVKINKAQNVMGWAWAEFWGYAQVLFSGQIANAKGLAFICL